MKKLFTLALALMGFAGASNAATVDDLEPLKHSYVLVCDDLGARPGKGVLFGANHFLDVTGGSTATNKGSVDLSVVDALAEDGSPLYVTQDIVDKYGADYGGPHLNWLRLKNTQDVIAMKLTAQTKLIVFLHGNNKKGTEARIPRLSKNADLSDPVNAAPDADHPSTVAGYRWECTVPDDGLYYMGSYNGDTFVSFIIVEAKEALGTPQVKIGDQKYEDGLWFREVSVKAVEADGLPTVVTYTTDGSTPNETSPLYKEPIKCYQDMTLKFQAYMDFGTATIDKAAIMPGADNEANVSFSFDAPAIEAEGANVTIVSPYENARNFLSLDGTESGAEELSQVTLDESATIYAYSMIDNGDYGSFKSKSTTKDVYVLNPIKEKKTIAVTSADVILDEEATATSTTGEVYKVENGVISADKKDFFVKNLEYAVVKDANYQIDGKEAYIKMNNTKITFIVAEGDSVNVKVICSKNACKNINADDNADNPEALVNDRKCMINVSGTNYFHKDAEGNEASDMKLCADANIVEFGLPAGTYTFQKYSGTGNILISSIEITPVGAQAAETELTLTEGHTLLVADIEAAGGTDDDIIRFDIVNQAGASRNGWGIGGFANSDNWTPIVEWTGVEGDAWSYEYTVAQIKQTAGTEPGQYHGIGITINIYNDCKVAKVTLVKGGDTAVKTIKTVNAADGVIYNLAGQKVSADYKGVVIINGKKVLNK